MRECGELLTRLGQFMDGELAPDEARLVAAHVQECPRCQRELQALQSLSASLEVFSAPPVPARMLGDVMLRVRDEASRGGRDWAIFKFWKPWPVAMRLAAAGVAAAACVIGLLLASAVLQASRQGRGEMAWVELSAGSGIAQAYLDRAP
jgi:anti-sigma factor RsiW